MVKESDWRTYKGSCKPLLLDIDKYGVSSFTFEILHLCKTRGKTNYQEAKELFTRQVLESEDYYNDNILSRFFRSNIGSN